MPAIVREWQWLDKKRKKRKRRLEGVFVPKVIEHFSEHWSWHDEVPLSVWREKGRIVRPQETGFGLLCAVSFHVYRHARWAVQRNDITSQLSNRSRGQISEIIETDWFTLAIIGPIKHTNACFADWLNGVISALCYIRLRSLREHDLLRWQCTTTRL